MRYGAGEDATKGEEDLVRLTLALEATVMRRALTLTCAARVSSVMGKCPCVQSFQRVWSELCHCTFIDSTRFIVFCCFVFTLLSFHDVLCFSRRHGWHCTISFCLVSLHFMDWIASFFASFCPSLAQPHGCHLYPPVPSCLMLRLILGITQAFDSETYDPRSCSASALCSPIFLV